mmetsp:Transcript_40675/g.117669  ORF Transcript_40675/g.117669 Transcript_40675/m.117669 type:complete len:277 (-) Transcript_40675:613-1443(-)
MPAPRWRGARRWCLRSGGQCHAEPRWCAAADGRRASASPGRRRRRPRHAGARTATIEFRLHGGRPGARARVAGWRQILERCARDGAAAAHDVAAVGAHRGRLCHGARHCHPSAASPGAHAHDDDAADDAHGRVRGAVGGLRSSRRSACGSGCGLCSARRRTTSVGVAVRAMPCVFVGAGGASGHVHSARRGAHGERLRLPACLAAGRGCHAYCGCRAAAPIDPAGQHLCPWRPRSCIPVAAPRSARRALRRSCRAGQSPRPWRLRCLARGAAAHLR